MKLTLPRSCTRITIPSLPYCTASPLTLFPFFFPFFPPITVQRLGKQMKQHQ